MHRWWQEQLASTLMIGVMNSSRKLWRSSEGQLWWMKLMRRPLMWDPSWSCRNHPTLHKQTTTVQYPVTDTSQVWPDLSWSWACRSAGFWVIQSHCSSSCTADLGSLWCCWSQRSPWSTKKENMSQWMKHRFPFDLPGGQENISLSVQCQMGCRRFTFWDTIHFHYMEERNFKWHIAHFSVSVLFN